MHLRKHHTYGKARSALWDAHRVDRDRTTERIELGLRVHAALTEAQGGPYVQERSAALPA